MKNELQIPPSQALALERFALITQIQDLLRQGFPLSVALEQVSLRPLSLPDGSQRLCARRTLEDWWYPRQDLRTVITYLQREIRAQRRNIGALKLSNLLQPDRFEEDLQISRVRLRAPVPTQPAPPSPPALPAREQQQGRQRALLYLRHIKATLR